MTHSSHCQGTSHLQQHSVLLVSYTSQNRMCLLSYFSFHTAQSLVAVMVQRVRGANFKYFCQLDPVPLTSCQKYLKLAHRAFNPIAEAWALPCDALQDAPTTDPNPKSCKLPLYTRNPGGLLIPGYGIGNIDSPFQE